MIVDQLEVAAKAEPPLRDEIIRTLADAARQTPGVYQELFTVLVRDKELADVATMVVRAIGYPQNATAIPALIYYVCDANAPAAPDALDALRDIPANVVVPYIVEMLWDRGATNKWWSKDVQGLAYALRQLGTEYALPCAPVIAYLLSDPKLRAIVYVPALLEVIEAIGPQNATFALPAVLDIVEQHGASEVRACARRLVESFAEHTLAVYHRVMPPANS